LFDAHPPFQIDGNFGCTAGIAEMLVQSHDGAIHILPALPDAWPSGTAKGLVARGGFVLDISWKEGKVSQVKVTSKLGGNCRIRVYDPLKAVDQVNFKEAKGENPNPFFAVAQIKQPVISEQAKTNPLQLKKIYMHDLSTQANGVYILTAL
jgi:alpha-L-fucosidase 2